jgi:hypothetical protein
MNTNNLEGELRNLKFKRLSRSFLDTAFNQILVACQRT